MSIYDAEGQLEITTSEIEDLLALNYIKADYFSCPAQVKISLPETNTIVLEKKVLDKIGFYDNFSAKSLMATIAAVINTQPIDIRESMITNLRIYISHTKQYINQFRAEAYNKFVQKYDEKLSANEFFETEYHAQDALRGFIGEKGVEFLMKRDPALNGSKEVNAFSKDYALQCLQARVKSFAEVILQTETPETCDAPLMQILSDITGKSADKVFQDYQKKGLKAINADIEKLDFKKIEKIDTFYNQAEERVKEGKTASESNVKPKKGKPNDYSIEM